MLQKWLGSLSLAEFKRNVLNKGAWARPGAAAEEAKVFGWLELDHLLRAQPRPDVLVVARGRLLAQSQPRSLGMLRALMSRGEGICVRHSEQQHPVLADLADALRCSFGTRVHAQVFATPGNTHGFSWHYDAEHVFIVQTAGVKDYYFRQNTVTLPAADRALPDFSLIRQERSALQTARLISGDCLYIPAGWWHMAHCVEDSLSVSLGLSE